MKRTLTVMALATTATLGLAGGASAQGKMTMYCGVQEEWCQLMVNEFKAKTGIDVAMTRKSSGEIFAQIKAEASNPKGDIWWGGTGDPHLQAAEENLTMAYNSPMMKELHPWSVSQHKTSGGKTVGIYLGALGYGYNSETLKKKGIAAPKCWADLAKPEYKGEVQVANPHASGTAYTFVATLVQLWGEDKAFDFLKKMNENVNQYTKSGAAPAQATGRGETLIGISFLHDVVTPATKGLPVVSVAPCEGTGFEIGSMSIIDGARNVEQAKKFYDWALSADAQALGAKAASFQNPSNKAAPLPKEATKMEEISLIDYDMKKYGSSAERTRLLSKWDAEIKATK
ncbi:ABC transporter substrate-binding protein [Lacibacterium aquatile]|uniref:ABC transporter substrate-binding protein n=1 Tax=Lacibacterium aquatile TaxID=1168082 RepID=A0ABW5DUC3_9PROT